MRDKIFLEGLETRCKIGIFPWERRILQRVVIDLEFPADIRKAARTENIRNAVDYKQMAKHILHFVSKSHYFLLETLAEKLAASILDHFSIRELRLRVSKPGAIRCSRNVGVEIFRKKP